MGKIKDTASISAPAKLVRGKIKDTASILALHRDIIDFTQTTKTHIIDYISAT